MQCIGIIPARFNSTRFPGKPLADIGGKSMIRRVYEQAEQVKLFSKIIVATDDLRILEHVESFTGNVLMTSDKHQSGTDRCGEVINTLHEEYTVVVNIQGDEPFIQPKQLEQLIHIFQDDTIQIATLAKKIYNKQEVEDPHIVKVVFDEQHHALYFSRNVIPFLRDAHTTADYYKHLGIYAYRSDILNQIIKLPQSKLEKAESLEQLRWLEHGFKIYISETDIETTGIDTPGDIEKIYSLRT